MRTGNLVSKLLFALAALAVFTFSYYLGNRYARPGHDRLQAFVFPEPQQVVPFRLVDKNGAPFTENAFRGHWNFVVTGDLEQERCRPLLFRYVLAWNYLANEPKLQEKTRVVFLDLGREPRTPEELKQFIDFYNPAFTAIDGDAGQKRRLARQLGVPEAALERGVQCDSQNGVVALISPDGVLLALFTGVTDPAAIARDLRFFQ